MPLESLICSSHGVFAPNLESMVHSSKSDRVVSHNLMCMRLNGQEANIDRAESL